MEWYRFLLYNCNLALGTLWPHPLPPGVAMPMPAPAAVALTGVGTLGAVACNALAIAAYQFPIPTALALAGVPPAAIPLALPANVTVDLFPIQQHVLRLRVFR